MSRVSSRDVSWVYSMKLGRKVPRTKGMGWIALQKDIDTTTMLRMLDGEDRASVRGFHKTRLVSLDIDMHDGPSRGWMLANARGVPNRPAAIAALRRRGIAEEAGHVVRAAAECMPEGCVLVESTANGFHVSMILKRPVSAMRAAMMASGWRRAVMKLSGIGKKDRVQVEAFPKVSADGKGRGCALPLSAGHRVVDTWSLETAHRTRMQDAQHVLDLPLIEPTTVEMVLEGLGAGGLVDIEPVSNRLDTSEEKNGQKFDRDFVIEALRLLHCGMADNESWHAVRWLTGAALYCGLSDRETVLFMTRYIERGHHQATHCQSTRGRRALIAKVRGQIKHFRRGLSIQKESGPACWRNGLKSDELREEIYGMIGLLPRWPERRPLHVLPEDRVRKKRSQAWAA